MTALTLAFAAVLTLGVSNAAPPSYSHWPGWAGINHMFVFGDSYTTTGFNLSLAQPSKANPLGNPAYPGYTASNGPNWVDFLAETYNATFLKAVNLAYGGATVDQNLIAQYLPTVLSFRQQVEDEYLPTYASHPSHFNWKPDNTLFASFFGINDVGNSYQNANASTVLAEDIAEYASLIDTIYQSGARNFLFLNVPPVNRAPLTTAQGKAIQKLERGFIEAYNHNISHLAKNLSSTYSDATTFVFNTNEIFRQVLNDPCSHEQTCPYKNTTGYCAYYENGTPSWYTFYQNCSIPVDEYFWLNTLHPTFRMHNVTAQAIAEQLSSS